MQGFEPGFAEAQSKPRDIPAPEPHWAFFPPSRNTQRPAPPDTFYVRKPAPSEQAAASRGDMAHLLPGVTGLDAPNMAFPVQQET